MNYNNIVGDTTQVQGFYKSIKQYLYLIIDIRGNGGGSDLYWQNVIVASLINKTISSISYILFRNGSYIKPFINNKVTAQKIRPINE